MYKVLDANQLFEINYADTIEEAIEIANAYMNQCGTNECIIIDENGNDVSDILYEDEEEETYTAIRYCYKYGNETDELVPTIKEFDSIVKAIKYAHRYAKGIRFCMCQIENESGKTIYEVMEDGRVFDYRNA